MMESMDHSPASTCFQTLPLELRNQIWKDALPTDVGSALFFFQSGCWHPRQLSDESYTLEWDFRELEPFRFNIPLVAVNHEARKIALAWIKENGVENIGQFAFVRYFDPKTDALYVPIEEGDEFIADPMNRFNQPDMLHQPATTTASLQRLAITETFLRDSDANETLQDMFHCFHHLKTLLVIVGEQPDEVSRWAFIDAQRGAFIREQGKREFNFEGNRVGDHGIYELIEEAIETRLSIPIPLEFVKPFEVRLAIAVRR